MGDDGLFHTRIIHKRRVPDVNERNSFRVVGRDENCTEYCHPRRSSSHCLPHCPQPSTKNVLGQCLTSFDRPANFAPPSRKAGYPTHLLGNVRTMMDPVSDVRTNGIPTDNGGAWWRHVPSGCVPSVPCYNPCTTSRIDYQAKCGPAVECVTEEGCLGTKMGHTRFSANPPHFYCPAVGGAPETCFTQTDCDGKPPISRRERISYEHDYNSREDPNYPWRGHRVGTYVRGKPRPINYNRPLGPIPSDTHLGADYCLTRPPNRTTPLPDISTWKYPGTSCSSQMTCHESMTESSQAMLEA